MSCILRIYGESLDIEALMALYPLPFDRIWKKGEPRILKGKFHSDSGANYLVSNADIDEFDSQVLDATKYLERYAPVIARMAEFPGVQNAILDFGFSFQEDSLAHFLFLPPKLVQLAASAGIGLEVSFYAYNKDSKKGHNPEFAPISNS